jgi:HTH-type transcriptional regulator/antitoxin HipB
MTPNQIAEVVRFHRKQSGLSQQALAKIAGVGKTAIFDIEKGKETVQLNTLLKVFDVLNIKMQLLTPMTQAKGEGA